MPLAIKTDLREILGHLQAFRCMAVAVEEAVLTPDLSSEIAHVDRILQAAGPLLAGQAEPGEEPRVVVIRGVGALRRLLL